VQREEFETVREFNKKFPSKFYICSRCENITTNPYQCTNCDNQSNNFIFQDRTYQYTIKETGKTEQIFKPIELEKGKYNEQKPLDL
jgi:hypothetical protein